MVGLVIALEDFDRLSPATRAELMALFGAGPAAGNTAVAVPAPLEAAGLSSEEDAPYPLNPREAKELLRGLSHGSRGVLRLFCQNFDGRVGRVSLEELLRATGHKDSQSLRKAISGITRRLRTVTGDKKAWILDWRDEDWQWDEAKKTYVAGAYFIDSPAIRSLCHAFGTEPSQGPS